jgi:hypothetical protein
MSDDLGGVGYTWNRKIRNNAVYYDKKGETLHFYTRIALYPQQQTGVFLSFNTYLPEHEINAVMQKATDLLYGKAPKPNLSSAETTIDIRGCYVNNWSSFKTPEKILRYMVPGKVLNISGSQNTGCSLNGERMTLIGDDTYSSTMGILKFLKKDGKIMIATESAITFSRVPFWHQSIIQVFILLLFIVLAFICFFRELILMLRKSKKAKVILLASSLLQIISFIVLVILVINGITAFSLLSNSLYLKICGYVIFAACAVGSLYTFYNRKERRSINILTRSWNVSGILFCIWMLRMNII